MKNVFIIAMSILALVACQQTANVSKHEIIALDERVIAEGYPQAKTEIRQMLADLNDAMKSLDVDRIESFHQYGPAFTRIQGGHRLNAAEGRKVERDSFGSMDRFVSSIEDLKIDVFHQTAIATMKFDWESQQEVQIAKGSVMLTLGLIKLNDGWKITYEGFSPISE